MTVIVFTGPTLHPDRARRTLDAVYRPPASQGDLYRAVLDGPTAIALIDGCFESVPAVWHKEILWALARDIPVFGAASMGALRAVELAPFGMIGIGWVFEAFRSGRLEDDDEVAVLHGPAELGYPVLTEAMVNMRRTVAAAVRAGVIRADSGDRLVATAKGLFYKERTYEAVLQGTALPKSERAALEAWLRHNRVDQKRRDALRMLGAVRTHLDSGAARLGVGFSFEYTMAWHAARQGVDSARTSDPGTDRGAPRPDARSSPPGLRSSVAVRRSGPRS